MYANRRFPSISREFIEYTLIEQTQTLISRRCLDFGYIPYVSAQGDNHIKLWDNSFSVLRWFLNKEQMPPKLVELNLRTKLAELQMTELRPVLISRCLSELSQMEAQLSSQTLNLAESLAEIERSLQEVQDCRLEDLLNSIVSAPK